MQNVPEKEIMGHIADLFKGFADPTRVHILSLLLVRQELCVTEIAEEVGVSQSGVSHQLRLLKQAKLVKNRREGKTVFYSLADDHVATLLRQGMEHIDED